MFSVNCYLDLKVQLDFFFLQEYVTGGCPRDIKID